MQTEANYSSEAYKGLNFELVSGIIKTWLYIKYQDINRGQNILPIHGQTIRETFIANSRRKDSIPVLICAHNEEKDIKTLLHKLSKSSIPLSPIVVDNQSDDATAEIASYLGAVVIQEPQKGLIFALKSGFKFLRDDMNFDHPFLLTDADSVPGTDSWASVMLGQVNKFKSNGGQIFGPVSYHSFLIDGTLKTLYSQIKDKSLYAQKFVKARGPNSIIMPDKQGLILQELADMDSSYVTGTDELVRDTITKNGGSADRIWDNRALVFSRSSRLNLLKLLKHLIYRKSYDKGTYKDWYAERPEGKKYISPETIKLKRTWI